MKRYIRVKRKWIDTLQALKEGKALMVIGKYVIDAYTDEVIGKCRGQSDEIVAL